MPSRCDVSVWRLGERARARHDARWAGGDRLSTRPTQASSECDCERLDASALELNNKGLI